MTEGILALGVAVIGSGGLAAALISWLKDRRKDNATARLTDVEALQKQVELLSSVTDFLRRENSKLQQEYELERDKNTVLRNRLADVEEELEKVKRAATNTQQQCEELSAKLRAFIDAERRTEHQ